MFTPRPPDSPAPECRRYKRLCKSRSYEQPAPGQYCYTSVAAALLLFIWVILLWRRHSLVWLRVRLWRLRHNLLLEQQLFLTSGRYP